MDIKKYELFADVAETKNFTKSGERIGYTQSGVSHILKSLENEIGFTLFARTKQGVRLTPNAKRLLPLVHALLSSNENLTQTINDLNGVNTGKLVIASFSSVSIHWLPKIIRRFQEIYPGITISLMEGGTDEIVGWVEDAMADFGFLSRQNIRGLDWVPLCDDPLMAVLPRDHPVPEGGRFPITGFRDQPFIISAMGTDYDVHDALDAANVVPCVHFTSKDDHAIISMISSHLGISILPKLVLRGYEDQVQAYPLDPFCSRNLGVAVKSLQEMSPAAKKFLKLTQEMLPELL
ncbi:MAG: LysR family transcriptional regulator [Oscillospiraceae bacterium]